METRHCMFIAVNLAAIATDATTYVILGIDFAINTFQALKIAYNIKYKNHSYEDGKLNHCQFLRLRAQLFNS